MNENKKTIMVLDENGKETEAEVLSVFNLKDTGRDYILYTLNETDENSMVKIYASILIQKEGAYTFEAIESDEEWLKVKEVIKQIAKNEQGQQNA